MFSCSVSEDRDTRRRRRREDRSRRRPWWLCIVGGCAFRTERERERRRLWWDWNILVTEREKSCPSWRVWIGGGFRSYLCHGEDGGDAVRSKRIVVLRGGFRSALCHGEDEKTITKPDGVSVVEDRCGGSVMGLNHSSVSSLFVTENTKWEEKKEREENWRKKKLCLSCWHVSIKPPLKSVTEHAN